MRTSFETILSFFFSRKRNPIYFYSLPVIREFGARVRLSTVEKKKKERKGGKKKKEKKRDGRKRKREIGKESKEKSEDPSALIGAHKYRIFILNGKTNDRSMPLVPGPH